MNAYLHIVVISRAASKLVSNIKQAVPLLRPALPRLLAVADDELCPLGKCALPLSIPRHTTQ